MVKMQDRMGNQTTTRKKKQHGNTNNVTRISEKHYFVENGFTRSVNSEAHHTERKTEGIK